MVGCFKLSGHRKFSSTHCTKLFLPTVIHRIIVNLVILQLLMLSDIIAGDTRRFLFYFEILKKIKIVKIVLLAAAAIVTIDSFFALMVSYHQL